MVNQLLAPRQEYFTVGTKVMSLGAFLMCVRFLVNLPAQADNDLLVAVHSLDPDRIRDLVAKGANVKGRDGMLALRAITNTHIKNRDADLLAMAAVLIEAGANPDGIVKPTHYTPLNTLCLNGKFEMAKKFIELGADPKRVSHAASVSGTRHCLSAASSNNHPKLVEYILANKLVPPTLIDGPTYWNGFQRACYEGHLDVVRVYLKYITVEEAEVPRQYNLKFDQGDGPNALMLAIAAGHMDIVRELVAFGCDPLRVTREGSALDAVPYSGRGEMRELMEQARARQAPAPPATLAPEL